MTNEELRIREQLNHLTDKLIDNIINTPDDEILKEVEEDYGDPAYEANKVRDIINKSWIKAGKNRLHAAKEELKKVEKKQQEIEEDITNYKEALSKYLNENPEFKKHLTIAARFGEGISEEEAKGILEDLKELKKKSPYKEDNEK